MGNDLPPARILDIDPAEYHLLPHFSGSVARPLILQSPLHAKLKYDDNRKPRKVADMSEELIRGAVLHHMLLGKGQRYEVCPFDNFTTKAAKETRDRYYAAGIIPVCTPKLERYETAAAALRERLADCGIRFTGRSEVAIEWCEDGLMCKVMIDHLEVGGGDEWADITEIKIHEDCQPERVERHVENMGYRIPAAAYIRALVAYRPQLTGLVRYRFAFCEPVPPYAVYCPDPDGPFLETGEKDWLRAARTWAACEREQRWPAYADFNSISRPRWKLRQEGYPTDEW